MAAECDVLIVGAGAAGLTAGTYAAHHGLRTVVVEHMMGGNQIINVEKIENFPGFPSGISGADLASQMQEQAMNAGAEFVLAEANGLAMDGPYKIVTTSGEDYRTKALIVAAGSTLRKLGIPGEEEFFGRGVSQCATCDGPLFNGEVVGVSGGGDSAVDEALTLAEYADRVLLFHRRDRLRAQKVLQERVLGHPKIEVDYNTVVESVVGSEIVTGVQVRNVVTNLTERLDVAGLFVYVGLEPNTEFVRGVLKTDNAGHIPVDLRMETAVPGIYAAGDIRQQSSSQLASAAGDGATAAIAAFQYINGQRWSR